jgi:AcrR family transcriptional regulator
VVAGEDTYDRDSVPPTPAHPASAQAHAGVVERLRARRSEIDEAIYARVSDRWFDRAGSEDPEYVAGLRAAGVAALDYILAGLERSGKSLAPVPAAALEQAGRAARIGVELETVLRRYLAGYTVLEGFVIQEADRDELLRQESALRDLLRITSALLDRLIAAVSRAYKKEIERATHAAPSRRKTRPAASVQGEEGQADQGTKGPPTPPGALRARARATEDAPVTGAGGPSSSWRKDRSTRRDRILQAIAEVVAERSYRGASVGLVVERARVSRRTFYELLPGGLDDGLIAVMDMALARIGVLVSPRLEEDAWQDGVRSALAALLAFFDSEPALARVCIVETLGAGPVVVEHREGVVRAFRALIMARIEREIAQVPPLVAESVMASVMGIIYARLVDRENEPLIELLGPLMGTVVAPFSAGEQMIAEEERRGNELAQKIRDGDLSWPEPAQPTARDAGPGAGAGAGAALPAALANPTARRLRECVMYLAEQGARGLSPSNREIATAIGVSHKSQISKLLSQLEEEGLAVKRSAGPGGPNQWRLTPQGEELARVLTNQEG